MLSTFRASVWLNALTRVAVGGIRWVVCCPAEILWEPCWLVPARSVGLAAWVRQEGRSGWLGLRLITAWVAWSPFRYRLAAFTMLAKLSPKFHNEGFHDVHSQCEDCQKNQISKSLAFWLESPFYYFSKLYHLISQQSTLIAQFVT